MKLRTWLTLSMLFSLLVTSPAFAMQDGPDAGRHVLSDNIAPFLFNYHDISSTGTVVASGDDAAGPINFPAGATLNIYGTPYTSLRASTTRSAKPMASRP